MRGAALTFATSAAAFVLCGACDDAPRPAEPPPTSRVVQGPRRIALRAVPFTAEVPVDWDVRRGAGGALVLNGPTRSGERDVAMSAGPRVAADALPATQPLTPDKPGSPVFAAVAERDGMRIIERLERGEAGLPADVAPVRWSFRFVRPTGGIDFPSYQFDVLNLTQIGYERDETTLRAIFDSLQFDAGAADAP